VEKLAGGTEPGFFESVPGRHSVGLCGCGASRLVSGVEKGVRDKMKAKTKEKGG